MVIESLAGRPEPDILGRLVARPSIGAVLDEIDVLIDGPYVEALADRAGPWTGSGN